MYAPRQSTTTVWTQKSKERPPRVVGSTVSLFSRVAAPKMKSQRNMEAHRDRRTKRDNIIYANETTHRVCARFTLHRVPSGFDWASPSPPLPHPPRASDPPTRVWHQSRIRSLSARLSLSTDTQTNARLIISAPIVLARKLQTQLQIDSQTQSTSRAHKTSLRSTTQTRSPKQGRCRISLFNTLAIFVKAIYSKTVITLLLLFNNYYMPVATENLYNYRSTHHSFSQNLYRVSIVWD